MAFYRGRTADPFYRLAERVKRNDRTLSEISFPYTIKNDDVRVLAEALTTNTTVCKFDVSFDGITICAVFSNMLAINKTLQELVLCHNRIDDKAAVLLAAGLKLNTMVKKLDLGDNFIGDDGAKALADMLKKNDTIVTLDLFDNEIDDKGAIALAAALEKNTSLQYLSLDINDIGRDGQMTLVKALKNNITLGCLNVDSVYDGAITALLNRNGRLVSTAVDLRIQSLFTGLYSVFGSDVYTTLLIIDCLPHYVLLNRSRKVALLQALIHICADQ